MVNTVYFRDGGTNVAPIAQILETFSKRKLFNQLINIFF